MRLGHVGEAEHFRHWVAEIIKKKAKADRLHTMYAIDGSEVADEISLEHLAGYGGSRPVRVGNVEQRARDLATVAELP